MIHTAFGVTTSHKSFVEDYLQLINGVLKLTPRQLEVLSELIKCDKLIAAKSAHRVQVAKKLGISTVAVLNNHIKALVDKKVLFKDSQGNYRYHPLVVPKDYVETVTIKLQYA